MPRTMDRREIEDLCHRMDAHLEMLEHMPHVRAEVALLTGVTHGLLAAIHRDTVIEVPAPYAPSESDLPAASSSSHHSS